MGRMLKNNPVFRVFAFLKSFFQRTLGAKKEKTESSAPKNMGPASFAAAVIALFIFCGMPTHAADSNSAVLAKEVTLDGTSYTQRDVLDLFLKSAFSKSNHRYTGYPEFRTDPPPGKNRGALVYEPFFSPARFSKEYPWLYPHLYFPEGMPKAFVLNKWVKPIRISVGYPNDLKPYISPEYKGKALTDYPEWPHFDREDERRNLMDTILVAPGWQTKAEAYSVVEQEARDFAPEISNLVNLPVSFLPHKEETKDNFASMRIILIDSPKEKFKFKLAPRETWLSLSPEAGEVPKEETLFSLRSSMLEASVNFTPEDLRQVEGLILPNARNEIDMTFCFIWNSHKEWLLRGLVRECMLRSLGIPERVISWKMQPEDTLNILLSSWNMGGRGTGTLSLSETDKSVVKTLYNPALKPGMSPKEALTALVNK